MSLLEYQRAVAEAALGEGEPPAELRKFRELVQAKRRRALARECRWFRRVPDGVVSEYLAEGGDRDFREFAEARVDGVTRELLRFERARERRWCVERFALDLRYVDRGRFILGRPRWWLVMRGMRPIPLWRAPEEAGV